MNDKLWISLYHGMELDPIAVPDARGNENGILFYVEYLFLKMSLKMLTQDDIYKFVEIVENLRTYDSNHNKIVGLFDRGAGESLNADKASIRTISHDNLTAITSFSKTVGLNYHKEIAEYGENNFWRFDNVYPEDPRWERIQHPRDIVYWSYLANKPWSVFFCWFVIVSAIISCLEKTETSGKCLTFVRLYPIKDKIWVKWTWKLCTWIINRNFEKGWETVFSVYFKNPDHPINILAREWNEEL